MHKISLVCFAFLLLFGCNTASSQHAFTSSPALPAFEQDSFADYLSDTKAWLMQHRIFLTQDKEAELDRVMPKEYLPAKPNGKGVLLVHGLGDSPFSFVDIAEHLADQGYLVRTLLLAGHSSKVGDLRLATAEDWQAMVAHQRKLLQQQTPQVWLGGYSTGANLVTSEALANSDNIEGLLLFSPAFKSGIDSIKYASLAQYFVTWADKDPENNDLRYNSLPMSAAAAYYQTVKWVQAALANSKFDKPVFMMMSEGDSVIDTEFAFNSFKHRMPNSNNSLVWQGEHDLHDSRVTRFSMQLPEQRIANGSHMGLLFSPSNPFYGVNGSRRICSNGQTAKQEQDCEQGKEVWYSAYGKKEPSRIYARLTYNPYFTESMKIMDEVME